MALTLIAVVLSLVLGHVAPTLAGLRSYNWFVSWLQKLGRVLGGQSAWQGRFGLLLGIGLPVLAIGAVQFALRNHFYGLPGFFFALAVLIYTWGPRDLDLDVDAVVEARDADGRRVRLVPGRRRSGHRRSGLGRSGVSLRLVALVRRTVLVPAARRRRCRVLSSGVAKRTRRGAAQPAAGAER